MARRNKPRRMVAVGIVSPMRNVGRNQSKNGHNPKVMPVVFIGGVLQSLCYLKMRNAHFTGETRQRTYEMLFNVYAYCDAIIFGMLCRFGRIRFRPYRIGIQ